MTSLPPSLKNISIFLQRLPGIGEKTANRLAFYLLRLPGPQLNDFAKAILELKQKTKLCKVCFNFTEDEVCEICQDPKRDTTKIIVVETVLDLLSFENGRIYNGVYHVLGGRIDPLENIGPEDIYINQLIARIKTAFAKASAVEEVILATNPDMEGEATAIYIKNKLKILNFKFRISRLGYGLPIGANLEYADYMTLGKALENRNNL